MGKKAWGPCDKSILSIFNYYMFSYISLQNIKTSLLLELIPLFCSYVHATAFFSTPSASYPTAEEIRTDSTILDRSHGLLLTTLTMGLSCPGALSLHPAKCGVSTCLITIVSAANLLIYSGKQQIRSITKHLSKLSN